MGVHLSAEVRNRSERPLCCLAAGGTLLNVIRSLSTERLFSMQFQPRGNGQAVQDLVETF